jgi:hypothetical protein
MDNARLPFQGKVVKTPKKREHSWIMSGKFEVTDPFLQLCDHRQRQYVVTHRQNPRIS